MADEPLPTVVLTGFMGTGKSTVGRALAERTGRWFVDTDAVIVDRHGPIPDLFDALGEEGFRTLEEQVCAELGGRAGLVIATGGGALTRPANRASLEPGNAVIWLRASAEEIVSRLRADGGLAERPLLAGDDPAGEVRRLLAERADDYGRYPSIDTDELGIPEIVDRLVALAGPAGG